jgi:hypothetical protein
VFIEPYTGGLACVAAAATEHCTRLMELDDQLCRFVERADCNVLHSMVFPEIFCLGPDDFESFFCLSETFVARPKKVTTKIKPTIFLKV